MKTTKHILTLVFIGVFSLVLTACSEEKKEQAEDSLSDFKNAASQAMDDAKDAASDAADKGKLYLVGQGGGNTVNIVFPGVAALRLQKDLVPVLVGKLNDFVFD